MEILRANVGAPEVIHVAHQPEPPNFEERVRRPGREYLASIGKAKPDFNKRNYWSRASADLYISYGTICAYSGLWIAPLTGSKSVEHFVPKSKTPTLAYEWENYRLVCGTLNGRKKDYEDVLDPFTIEDGWFTLQFPSSKVHPYGGLAEKLKNQVAATINRLKLNDEVSTENREAWLRTYCEVINGGCAEGVAFQFLERNAPFIAKELERQNLRGSKVMAMRNSGAVMNVDK